MSFKEEYKNSLERLESFVNEKYNWDGHGGRPLAHVTAEYIDTFLSRCYLENISEPSLALGNDGSVAIVWEDDAVHCYVDFSNNRDGYIYVVTSPQGDTIFSGIHLDYLVANTLLGYLKICYSRKTASKMLPYKAGHDLTMKAEYTFKEVGILEEPQKRLYTDQKSKDFENKLKLMNLTDDINKQFAPLSPVTPEQVALGFVAQEVINDCKDDHGERTNKKLKDQPYYHRGRRGKMKNH